MSIELNAMQVDWSKLPLFVATAECGSLTRAAEKMNLSQSVLSRQMSALETELGASLFHRHARGLVLTHQGEILFKTAKEVLARLEHARDQLAEQQETPKGDLKITTTVAFGTHWLASRLRIFIERNPDITINLILEDAALDLGMREADVAIRFSQPMPGDLIQRKLFTVHFHSYASIDYVQNYGQPKTDLDLPKHKLLGFAGEHYSFAPSVNHLLHISQGKELYPTIRMNSIMGLKEAAEDGAGIVVLPDYLVGENSRLLRVLPSIELPSIDTFFVYPEEQKNIARIRAFRDYMVGLSQGWKY